MINKTPKFIIAALSSTLLFPSNLLADDNITSGSVKEQLEHAFKEMKPYIDMRYRYENVDQANLTNEADASTLRTKLGVKTGEFYKTYAVLEGENVTRVASGQYNDTVNGKGTYPTVADPDGTEVNQAYLNFGFIPDTEVRLGRQIVNLDNQRFVGSVGWRQNDQTLDAIGVRNTSIPDLSLYYNYANNINKINGDDHATNGNWDSNLHLFNAKYSGFKYANITAYGYWLDIDDSIANSSQTYGGSIGGKYPVNDDLKLLYHAEYASQSDYSGNTNNYDANYWHVNPGVSWKGLTVKAGYEVLESDQGTAATTFRTPLATGHKFNGWADKFLATPAGGLEDAYGSISYKISGVHEIIDGIKLMVAYHDFSAEQSGVSDYGDEWNFLIARKFSKHYNVAVKYATFDADANGGEVDTDKLWIQFGVKF